MYAMASFIACKTMQVMEAGSSMLLLIHDVYSESDWHGIANSADIHFELTATGFIQYTDLWRKCLCNDCSHVWS